MGTRAATVAAMLVIALLTVLPEISMGQQATSACAQKLIPCSGYLNSTKPPQSCCGPLTDAVKNDLPCLCDLFNNQGLITALKINLTQALELPKHCGINSNERICANATLSSPALSPGSTPSSTSPAPPASNNKSGACAIKLMGFSATVSLFLFFWSIVVV